MTQIQPYLSFNGKCREAMEYYKSCFGGELTLQTVAGTPMESQCPASMRDHIMHAMLKQEQIVLMGTDMVSPDGYHPGNSVAISISCSNDLEIKNYFSYLSDGAKIIEPLADKFWGATFGCLKDKFGVTWLLNHDKTSAS